MAITGNDSVGQARADLNELIASLPSLTDRHAPSSESYIRMKARARQNVDKLFSSRETAFQEFGPFGPIAMPYVEMGVTSSLNLFDLDELIIFAFYWNRRNHYHKVLDLGANLGLHSIMLSKCGFEVRAYEPDPFHFQILQRNLAFNNCKNVQTFRKAVSTTNGTVEFVRVVGNTTGSHIAGAKSNPYGELERFTVETQSIADIIRWADLIKMDVEGHEKEVLLATNHQDWAGTDALVEVGSSENAGAIFQHFTALGINLFCQKNGWSRASKVEDMPVSYRDGSVFITSRNQMSWRDED